VLRRASAGGPLLSLGAWLFGVWGVAVWRVVLGGEAPGWSHSNHATPNLPLITTPRALRDIHLGEEVAIGYVELAAPRLERRQQLLQQYFFDLDGSSDGADGADSANGSNTSSSINRQPAGAPCSSSSPFSAADVQLWGQTPDWWEQLEERGGCPSSAPHPAAAAAAAAAAATSSSGSSSTGSTSWWVLGFGAAAQPPWRQDAADGGLCEVTLLPAATNAGSSGSGSSSSSSSSSSGGKPLPGGLMVVPGCLAGARGDAAADAATAAAALGPAAGSFPWGEVGESGDRAVGQDAAAAGLIAQQLQALSTDVSGAPSSSSHTFVLQWGDWGAAAGPAASARPIAIAAAVQVQRICRMQAEAERMDKVGQHAAAASLLTAALQLAACLPPAVAAAAQLSRPPAASAPQPPAVVALGSRHVLRQRLLAALLNAAVAAGECWPLALAAAEALTPCYEAAYPQSWPSLGLHLAMVAKLQLLLERPSDALQSADRAITHLKVCCVCTERGGGGKVEVFCLGKWGGRWFCWLRLGRPASHAPHPTPQHQTPGHPRIQPCA